MAEKATTRHRVLGTPPHRQPLVNGPKVWLPQRRQVATAGVTDTGRDRCLYLVDADTLETRRFSLPEGPGCGIYVICAGADGALYLGAQPNELWYFDLAEACFEKLADVDLPVGASWWWGGVSASTGRAYLGTYGTSTFVELDTRDRSHRVVPVGRGPYCGEFLELPDGRILVATFGPGGGCAAWDPGAASIEHVDITGLAWPGRGFLVGWTDADHFLLDTLSNQGPFVVDRRSMAVRGRLLEAPVEAELRLGPCCVADDDVLTVGMTTGRIYRLRDGEAQVVHEGLPNGNRPTLVPIGRPNLLAVGDNGHLARMAGGRVEASAQIDNVSECGMGMSLLIHHPGGRCLVGAHWISSQMFRLDLVDGACESSLSKLTVHPGQVPAGVALGDRVYLATYGGCNILAYDPARPFACGENPRVIGSVGHEQNRPVAMFTDGKCIYIASRADYGKLGGAISVLDPAGGRIRVHRHFVPHHAPAWAQMAPGQRVVVGTTSTGGDSAEPHPDAGDGVVFLWDADERRTLWTGAPWPGLGLKGGAVDQAGLVFGWQRGRYFLFDIVKRQFVRRADLPWESLYAATFGDDGALYCSVKTEVCRWDLGADRIETLARAGRVPEDESRQLVFTTPRTIAYARGPDIREVSW